MAKKNPWDMMPRSLIEWERTHKNLRLLSGDHLKGIGRLTAHQQLASAFNPSPLAVFKAFEDLKLAVSRPVQPIVTSMNSVIASAASVTGPFLTVFQKFESTFKLLNEKTRIMIEECIKEGWYPIAELDASFFPEAENFETEMANAIEECMYKIEKNICERNSARAFIIKSAFNAHRRDEFELSIPCLFSQADGICYDVLKIQPFTNQHGKRLKDKIDLPASGTFASLYFKPLFDAEDIRKNSKHVLSERLNRHAVMHGTSTTCYTKINSLKLISFIGSLDWFLDDFRNEDNDTSLE